MIIGVHDLWSYICHDLLCLSDSLQIQSGFRTTDGSNDEAMRCEVNELKSSVGTKSTKIQGNALIQPEWDFLVGV